MNGKVIRLRRIFQADGRAVVVALDHGQFKAPAMGLADLKGIIGKVINGGTDGVILNPGPAKQFADTYAGKTSLILRLTGASTDYNQDFDYHRQIATVKQAVVGGADAVIAMGFIGGKGEARSLELLGRIADECQCCGMPLVAEMLPASLDHFYDTEWVKSAARVGYELGADCIKAYFTGTPGFGEVITHCPVPILIAGGPKVEDPLSIAQEAIALGAAGVAFGRNVFEGDDPIKQVKRLVGLVHQASG